MVSYPFIQAQLLFDDQGKEDDFEPSTLGQVRVFTDNSTETPGATNTYGTALIDIKKAGKVD